MAKPVVFVFTTAYHPFIGGAEVAIQEVAKRLRDDFQFYIITARLRRDLPSRSERHEGTVIRIGFGSPIDKWLLPFLGAAAALRELRKTHRPGILWGVDISTGALAAAFLKWRVPRIPFILNIQYGYGEARLRRGRLGLIGLGFRFMLGRAEAVTAISTHLAGLARSSGYRGAVKVIPNGVSLEAFPTARPERAPGSPPTVITVSRLVPKNGIDMLIRAMAKVKKSPPDIRCRIIGDGPERRSLEALTNALGVRGAVTFVGEIPPAAVPSELAQADVFVRPSRSEGMGNAFVEALASGLPIIGTPVGGIPDIIEDGETGLFARVDDPADLAAKIKQLIADPHLAGYIVANGRKMVGERFSWATIAHHYGELFLKALRPQPRILIATGIFPPDIGGPATYSQTIAGELSKRGFSVQVLTYGGGSNSKFKVQNSKLQSKIQSYHVSFVSRRLPKGVRHLWYFLRCLMLGRRADLIYAQDPVSVGLPAMLAAKLSGRTFALRVAGDYAWEQGVQRFGVQDSIDGFQVRRYGFRTELLRSVQRLVTNHADAVIAPSEYFRKLVSGWVIDPTKVHRVYNGLNLEELDCPPGIRQAQNLMLSAGRLVPWKGFLPLIELMPALPGWQLLIAGDGPDRSRLASRIRALGLGDRVTLSGSLSPPALREALCRATVFVLNSSFESFSFQVVEAMHLGVPVVTTNIGNLPEIIADGREGVLVRPDAHENIIGAVRRLAEDEPFRNTIIHNAREKAKRFSLAAMLAELTRLLEEVTRVP